MSLSLNDRPLVSRRFCEKCGKPIAKSTLGTMCPECQREEIYPLVKKYIEENPSVTEMEVADIFQLPLSDIKFWIKEGRIEYKPRM